ncbi:hypothetical protein PpBr36_00054 [Pyricularia pennisetigena]|uniref:hypothetical protein n=1 Tax=Pyricularia pennisetigena TaxID=1578925 RepID=UPI001152297E|nr:hypothetical protein PpBr36_00054 [Pyricularia pennisetigena]TLS28142.1 hypothetical protein PpBr36_00054 [Pyricularia pennisetigena]
MSQPPPPRLYPSSPRDALVSQYVGQPLSSLPTPAAVLDVAAVRRNCGRMLSCVRDLGLQWRAHVKTHKTAEVTRLQVGDDGPARIVVSTLEEAEFLLPLLREYGARGRPVSVLYGLPLPPGQLPRLAAVGRELGRGSVAVLVDHPAQLERLEEFARAAGADFAPHAYLKIDMGGRRAGVQLESAAFAAVVQAALRAHDAGAIVLSGLYSHAGHSYAGDSRAAAVAMMAAEIGALLQGADAVVKARAAAAAAAGGKELQPLVLSAGASPTALAVQNLLSGEMEQMTSEAGVRGAGGDDDDDDAPASQELMAAVLQLGALLEDVQDKGHVAEIHAGVYPLLDMQQLAAHSVARSALSWRDVALTVLAEVCSVYPGRGDGGTPEALCGAGGLALGREFCKAYPGMAVVSPWGRTDAAGKPMALPECDVEDYEGWIVGRFAQEHGILTWRGKSGEGVHLDEFAVGQKIRLWPNHACITSSHFGWYFVVDSDRVGKEDEVVDIYIKTRGW